MITEDYISFETAKILKEKGFDWECISYYVDDEPDNVKYSFCGETNSTWESRCCSAPTLQMAMKWLRLTHKIYIQALAPVYDMDCAELGVTYNVIITNLANQCLAFDTPLDDIEYNSPEEAYEAAVKYCLENLI